MVLLLLLDKLEEAATGTAGDDQLPQEEDALILEATSDTPIADQVELYGACIDSGAQITLIDSGQAEAHCHQYGGSHS